MHESRQNILVGAFVLVGLLAFGTLVVMFGQAPQWLSPGDTYELEILFDSVAGIRTGTNVVVAGNRIGHVRRVEFVDEKDLTSGVRVIAAIETKYELPVGTRAETVEAGIFGGGRPPIVLQLGDASLGMLDPATATIKGKTTSGLDSVFPQHVLLTFERTASQIGEAADALKPVLTDLEAMLQPRDPELVDLHGEMPGNLSSASARLDTLLAHFNEVLGSAEQQSRIAATLENMKTISDQGVLFMDDLRAAGADAKALTSDARGTVTKVNATLDDVNTRVNEVARSTNGVLEKASRMMDHLTIASGRIAEGQGTLGKLVNDPQLYESMVLTAKRMAETVDEMRLLIEQWQKGKIKVGF